MILLSGTTDSLLLCAPVSYIIITASLLSGSLYVDEFEAVVGRIFFWQKEMEWKLIFLSKGAKLEESFIVGRSLKAAFLDERLFCFPFLKLFFFIY